MSEDFYRTCTTADCPDLPEEVLSKLCDIWHPYGSKCRCLKTYENGTKSEVERKD